MKRLKVITGLFVWILSIDSIRAEEGPSVTPSPAISSSPTRTRPAQPTRETEGSQAPNRFEGETVIKSVYTQDGVALEVDPD